MKYNINKKDLLFRKFIPFLITLSLSVCVNAQNQSFEPTFQSLQQYECPEWFRDAKFGIYCHWNAQSASKSRHSGWYARQIYTQGSSAYKDHLKNWGHPSKVGYKDVVESWQAEQFDAGEWVRLFKDAGAKYIVTMAVHHDNFDLWDSKHQPKWNSLNYGPGKDVCGEMKRETLKAGLRWGVDTHVARTYSWFETSRGADLSGSLKGIPYDGNDPEYQDLYGPLSDQPRLGTPDDQLRHPLNPPESWKTHWKKRMFDLIDNYHPDFFYFDGALPFMNDDGKAGMEVIAHYYNHNARLHNGRNEGIMVIKDITKHGFYYPGISSVVMERSRTDYISREPRQTENSIGPWFHSGDTTRYRTSESLLHEMIDVVSKNCNFMLNIPPKGDGSFDEPTRKILSDLGQWLQRNGESIYGTRPWNTYGEGDVRYTRKENVLYVTSFERPEKSLLLKSLQAWKKKDIKQIEFLGNKEVPWKKTREGVIISIPDRFSDQLAYTFKITCSKDPLELPFAQVDQQSVEEANREAALKYGADGHGGQPLPGQGQEEGDNQGASDQDLLTVLNWNTLYCFNHGKAIPEGVEWIKNHHTDVVALQELNGQTNESFNELAKRWDHDHAVLLKEEGFPVGLTSNKPIEVFEKRTEGFHHGFLHCKTQNIHFFVIHLWPDNDPESLIICKVVKELIDAGEKVIILGDFNAKSALDHEYLSAKPAIKSKVDYRVLTRFANLDMVDLTHKHDPKALVSFPSPIVIPKWHKDLESVRSIESRIDFILASKKLEERSKASTIIRSPELDRISDHYPVIAVFK